jgi:hypothetical protein
VTPTALFNGRSTDAQFRQFDVRTQGTLAGALGSVSSWADRTLFGRYE